MASAKMNRAVIESVLNSLSKANFDPSRAIPSFINPGFFASEEDRQDATRAPAHILRILKIRVEKGDKFTKQEMKHFVEKEVWTRSCQSATGLINLDLTFGRSPKRHIQEAREAIEVLRALGDKDGMAKFLERLLEKKIGAV